MRTEPRVAPIPASELGSMVQESANDFKVHTRVYTDQQIFELEMERIYENTWIYVAHESEIVSPGDYKTAYLGLQPVIVSRSEDGKIHVLFNRCRHRASVVCREEHGNANYFRCPYHGWVYGNDGKLNGIAQFAGAYCSDFDKSDLNLVKVARVETYRGMIFACNNPDVEPLVQWFGGAKKYIDFAFDRSPTGEISLKHGVHRWEYNGNWKFQLENTTDGYHGNYVHESFFMLQEKFGGASGRVGNYVQGSLKEIKDYRERGARTAAFENGHGLLEYAATPETIEASKQGKWAMYMQELEALRGGPDGLRNVMGQYNVQLFPNVAVIHGQIRVIRPVAPNRCEVSYYPFALEGAPDEYNAERLRGYERFFGPAAFGATDDVEIFALNQAGLNCDQVDWLVLARGMNREEINADGERVGKASDEITQRNIYRQWKKIMGAAEQHVSVGADQHSANAGG